jgi:hypothetical protein
MKLAWERPGVVRMTARLEELAALVAGGRMALEGLDGRGGEQVGGLVRVLADFDRAAHALRSHPIAGPTNTAEAMPAEASENENGGDR